jgi:hypothetical protein
VLLIRVTGIDEETGQLVVGFHAGGAKVNKVSTVKHNFPPHVVEAAQVGISLCDRVVLPLWGLRIERKQTSVMYCCWCVDELASDRSFIAARRDNSPGITDINTCHVVAHITVRKLSFFLLVCSVLNYEISFRCNLRLKFSSVTVYPILNDTLPDFYDLSPRLHKKVNKMDFCLSISTAHTLLS